MVDDTLSRAAREKASRDIHPIVEFFEIDYETRNEREFINTSETDRKLLRGVLRKSKGIYAFYNSEREIIYVGKSKAGLWEEMKIAYNREMPHYQRYLVRHPRKYSPTRSGLARGITRSKQYVWNCAAYFSAYRIEDDTLIDLIELMIIRIVPNDLLNVRMEGNTTLRDAGNVVA